MQVITIKTTVHAPVETVWEQYTAPEHIVMWNAASDDWHTTRATNDLRVGGIFSSRMEAKDKSMGFDFGGTYTKVHPHKELSYTLGDGRKADIVFDKHGSDTTMIIAFEAEHQNSIERQRSGWQAILDNFKKHVEK